MTRDPKSVRRAAAVRDAAAGRVRRVTAGAVALAAALTGVFTAMAAGSTHPRRVLTTSARTLRVHRAHRSSRPVTQPVVAPEPPLVAVRSGGETPPPPVQQSQPVSPTPASTPAPAPAPAPAATPVVVSGGS